MFNVVNEINHLVLMYSWFDTRKQKWPSTILFQNLYKQKLLLKDKIISSYENVSINYGME